MQLSGHGGRWRVLFPTITITDVWVVGCFGDGMSLLFLLALAFVLPVVVWAAALAFCGMCRFYLCLCRGGACFDSFLVPRWWWYCCWR